MDNHESIYTNGIILIYSIVRGLYGKISLGVLRFVNVFASLPVQAEIGRIGSRSDAEFRVFGYNKSTEG